MDARLAWWLSSQKMQAAKRVQILDEALYVSVVAYTQEKGINPNDFTHSTMDK